MCGCEASGRTRPPLPGGSPVPKGQACAHPASGAVIQRGGTILYVRERRDGGPEAGCRDTPAARHVAGGYYAADAQAG